MYAGNVCGALYLLSNKVAFVTSGFKRYVVSSVVRILNVSSVEQIRRRRSARLKGMAFLCVEDDKKNKVNAGVCP